MDIKLKTLTLENFKGIRAFTLAPDGRNTVIRGENATGKTTLADGFRWLLFGKDMADRADFALKTLDGQNQPIPGLDHAVGAVLLVDGQEVALRKVFKEKWTKKRGEATRTFTGHTTDNFIDGVPIQEKDWNSRINAIISEETLKLLTSPIYFNSLHWQKRREILLEVCGDISDASVIASEQSLAGLPGILNGHSLDDQRKIIAGQRKEINGRLAEIPARIDELTKSIAEAEAIDRVAVQAEIAALDAKIQTAKDNSELAKLRKEKAEFEARHTEAIGEHGRRIHAAREGLLKEKEAVNEHIRDLQRGIDPDQIARIQEVIKVNETAMAKLREEFTQAATGTFEIKQPTVETVCPTCGQNLPAHQVEVAREKFLDAQEEARKAFFKEQSETLEKINARGKALKETNEENLKEIATLEQEQAKAQSALIPLQARLHEIQTALEQIGAKPTGLEATIATLDAKIKDVSARMESVGQVNPAPWETKRKALAAQIAQIDAAVKSKDRIEDLKAEEKKLTARYEELERQTFLMERFIVAKVGLLEEKINSRFELVKWKLFETQINEGIKETCGALVNGVPYGSGLNRGAEINAGLDIIRTLSQFYNVTAPVWLDNREAVTTLIAVPSQVISLVVDPNHKEMEVIYD